MVVWRLVALMSAKPARVLWTRLRRVLPKLGFGSLLAVSLVWAAAVSAQPIPSQSTVPEQLLRPGNKDRVTPELVADAHRRGLKVFVFTVNEPRDIAHMSALGVDGVFSDYPERVLALGSCS